MRRLFSLLAALSILLSSCTRNADIIDEAWLHDNYSKREVYITMRDGVRLFTSIYEPRDSSTRHPILLHRTCYSSSPYGDEYAHLCTEYNKPYLQKGYIFVSKDVRGKCMSEGSFEDIRPFIDNKLKADGSIDSTKTDEASDTYDTAEWLVNNTSSNGCIGVLGISYPGFYSTMAALSGHPAIKAVSPQAPVTDWFMGDDVHHNGAFLELDIFTFEHFFQYFFTKEMMTADVDFDSIWSPSKLIVNDAYSDMLRMGSISNLSKALGDSVIMWNNAINHPDLDEWWESRNILHHISDVKPAVMVVGGLFDAEDCYGALATYKTIKRLSPLTSVYLVEGPWSHGMWRRRHGEFFGNVYFGPEASVEHYIKNIEFPFFEYYLNDSGEKPDYGARIFDSGNLTWNDFADGWPDSQARPTDFYLLPDGQLSTESPSTTMASAKYVSDPKHPVPYTMQPSRRRTTEYMLDDQRFASQRPDVATFATASLDSSLTLSGEVSVDLSVAISTTDADFIVKIIDVFPDGFEYPDSIAGEEHTYPMGGYQMLVRGDIMRGRYRNSFSLPEPFSPGMMTTVHFSMPDVSHTILPGHRLMIQVQSSWFPLADRNPQQFVDIYHATDEDFIPSDITIYNSSKVTLPIVKER